MFPRVQDTVPESLVQLPPAAVALTKLTPVGSVALAVTELDVSSPTACATKETVNVALATAPTKCGRHFDPHIRSLIGHQARGRLDASIDLREAAARKLIAVVDLRRHQISLRSGLAGAGLSIVGRVEVVSELVCGNQR